MEYLITFLEGISSFISPCILPMIPIYISYFAGNMNKKNIVLLRSFAFVLGFTVIFCTLGIFAGTLGALLIKFQAIVNIACGIIVIIFGLSYLGVINIQFFKGITKGQNIKNSLSSFLFGMVFSLNLTPCVGAFLGSALMMASTAGTVLKGMLLLLTYSLGLGIPFIISAVLIDKLGNAFSFIKKHYKIINSVCGVFLIITGILIAFGFLNNVLNLFVR